MSPATSKLQPSALQRVWKQSNTPRDTPPRYVAAICPAEGMETFIHRLAVGNYYVAAICPAEGMETHIRLHRATGSGLQPSALQRVWKQVACLVGLDLFGCSHLPCRGYGNYSSTRGLCLASCCSHLPCRGYGNRYRQPGFVCLSGLQPSALQRVWKPSTLPYRPARYVAAICPAEGMET